MASSSSGPSISNYQLLQRVGGKWDSLESLDKGMKESGFGDNLEAFFHNYVIKAIKEQKKDHPELCAQALSNLEKITKAQPQLFEKIQALSRKYGIAPKTKKMDPTATAETVDRESTTTIKQDYEIADEESLHLKLKDLNATWEESSTKAASPEREEETLDGLKQFLKANMHHASGTENVDIIKELEELKKNIVKTYGDQGSAVIDEIENSIIIADLPTEIMVQVFTQLRTEEGPFDLQSLASAAQVNSDWHWLVGDLKTYAANDFKPMGQLGFKTADAAIAFAVKNHPTSLNLSDVTGVTDAHI